MSCLDRTTISSIDSAGQVDDILSLPEHIKDALWRVESADIAPMDTKNGLVVAGMGGSAIGGMLAKSILGDRACLPLTCARAYGLPAWVTPDTTVLCASYSGNTEETLACFESAGALGTRRIVVTSGGKLAELARSEGVPVIPVPGGLQPRAAVAYMTVAALEVAAICGVGQTLHSELDVAAAHTEELVKEWGPDGSEDSLAKSLARSLNGTVPLITGSGLTKSVAYRWKTQINENAKTPCFWHELPEMNHNEIVGWQGAEKLAKFSAIFLNDSDLHPRIGQRIELTQQLVDDHAEFTEVVEARGDTPTERVFSLVLLGDLVSLYMAILKGVDPSPVPVIEDLKSKLALVSTA